jgi:hypothetical protein
MDRWCQKLENRRRRKRKKKKNNNNVMKNADSISCREDAIATKLLYHWLGSAIVIRS